MFFAISALWVSLSGPSRKGPLFHGSQSYRGIKIQNASCQMGGHEATAT